MNGYEMVKDLPGWTCENPTCLVFNGSMKKENQRCRACDAPRPEGDQPITATGRAELLRCIAWLSNQLALRELAHTEVQARCTELLKLAKPLHCFHEKAEGGWCSTCGALRSDSPGAPWILPGGLEQETKAPPMLEVNCTKCGLPGKALCDNCARTVPPPEECVCPCRTCVSGDHPACCANRPWKCMRWTEANNVRAACGLPKMPREYYFAEPIEVERVIRDADGPSVTQTAGAVIDGVFMSSKPAAATPVPSASPPGESPASIPATDPEPRPESSPSPSPPRKP